MNFRHDGLSPEPGFRIVYYLLTGILQVQQNGRLNGLPRNGVFTIVVLDRNGLSTPTNLGEVFAVHSGELAILAQFQTRQAHSINIGETNNIAGHVAVGINPFRDFFRLNARNPQLRDFTPDLGSHFFGDIHKGRGFFAGLRGQFPAQLGGVGVQKRSQLFRRRCWSISRDLGPIEFVIDNLRLAFRVFPRGFRLKISIDFYLINPDVVAFHGGRHLPARGVQNIPPLSFNNVGTAALILGCRGEFRSLHQLHHHQADRKNEQHRDNGPHQQVFSDSTHLTSFAQLCQVFTLPRRDREGFS